MNLDSKAVATLAVIAFMRRSIARCLTGTSRVAVLLGNTRSQRKRLMMKRQSERRKQEEAARRLEAERLQAQGPQPFSLKLSPELIERAEREHGVSRDLIEKVAAQAGITLDVRAPGQFVQKAPLPTYARGKKPWVYNKGLDRKGHMKPAVLRRKVIKREAK